MKTIKSMAVIGVVMAASFISVEPIHAKPLSQSIIQKLKAGHKKTCIPTTKKYIETLGVDPSFTNLSRYCDCVGEFYFDDFTVADYKNVKKGNLLPARHMKRRAYYQQICYDKTTN